MSITYYDQPPLDYSVFVIQLKKLIKLYVFHWFFKTINISFALKLRQAGTGWAQPELTLDRPPLQSLSVDRGRAGAILIDIDDDDDGDDDDSDDDDDDDDDDGDDWCLNDDS